MSTIFTLFYCSHSIFICILEYVAILISAAFRGVALITGETLIRGRHLFQCGYPKARHLLECGAYLRSGAY